MPGKGLSGSVEASLQHHDLYQLFRKDATLRLKTNVRLEQDQEAFRNFLLKVGTAHDSIMDVEGRVQLPKPMCLIEREELLKFVFPEHLLLEPVNNWEELAGCAILSPLNVDTLEMNELILVTYIFLLYIMFSFL